MTEDKPRALIVGAGGMGKAWGRNLLSIPEQVSIAGWVDVQPGVAEKSAAEIGVHGAYTSDDLAKALAEVKPDFVVDVTIPEAHRDVTVQSLEAGIPVLGEKPMADSMAHAREMVAASEKAGKLYMVSQSRRYDRNLSAFRNLIEQHVGRLGILNSDFYIGAHFGGFRDQMRSPLVLDMAIHTFDAARYLCGLDPVAVYCDEFNPSWSWYQGDAAATAIFEMEGGLRYTYRGAWCSQGRPTSWEAEWRAAGEKGTALWDGVGDHAPLAGIVTPSGKFTDPEEVIVAERHATTGGIAGSIQDFLHALHTGATPMGECHDNVKSLAMVFAAMESSDTKQRVKIEI